MRIVDGPGRPPSSVPMTPLEVITPVARDLLKLTEEPAEI